jgi:hypothetical protein
MLVRHERNTVVSLNYSFPKIQQDQSWAKHELLGLKQYKNLPHTIALSKVTSACESLSAA